MIDQSKVIDVDFTPVTDEPEIIEEVDETTNTTEEFTLNPEQEYFNLDEHDARRKANVEKLPRYCGEVPTKTALRKLPNLAVGDIYWVTTERKPYIITEKEKGKTALKELDENATISTGYTIYEMNKKMVSKEPVFDYQDAEAVEKLMLDVKKYLSEDTSDKQYLMYCREQHYFSLFERRGDDVDVGALIETIGNIGKLISIDRDSELGDKEALEIWVRTPESKADLYYFIPFDNAVIYF